MTLTRLRAALRAPQRPTVRRLALAAGLGVALAAGQAPWGLWWGALPALAGLVWLAARASSPAQAAWLGWLAGAGHFAAALHWIVEPFLVDPVRHGWMAPFALVLMALGLALFWALAGWLGHWLGGARPALRAVALAVGLAAVELARGHVLTGFPWAMPGHVWVGTPVAQAAALVGASGLTLGMALLAALPAVLALSGPAAVPRPWRFAGGSVLALALLAGVWGWGQARLSAALPAPAVEATLRLVQPNAEQRLKWDPGWMRIFFDRQIEFTAAAPAGPPPDLVIWPETAIPWLLEDAGPALEWIAEAAGPAQVLLGVQRAEAGRFYNSLAALGPDGAPVAVYDKHHLVPFGEYVPLAEALLGTGLAGFAARQLRGYSAGPGPVLLDLGRWGQVLPLICYEAVFPRHSRHSPRPDWIVQVTNDGWFGQLSGPFQHLAQARLRAIEQGLPLVRVANTGVSAVIDPRGRIVAQLGLGEAGLLDAALPPALPPTAFAATGEAPLAWLMAGLLAGLAGVRRRWAIDPAAGQG